MTWPENVPTDHFQSTDKRQKLSRKSRQFVTATNCMQHNQTNITKPTYNFSLCSKVTATFSVMEQVTEQLQNEQQVTWDFPLEGPVSGVNHPGINWRWGKMFIIIPNKRPNVSKSLCQKYSWFEMFSSWTLWYFVFQCVFLVVVVTLFSL